MFQKFFENSNFYGNCTLPQFDFFFSFCPTLGPIYPIKEAEIEKTKHSTGQNLSIGLSEYCKIKALSCPNFSGKIRLLFALFWPAFAKKGVWSKVKGSESKFDLPYCSFTIPGHVPVKKFWSQHLPVLRLQLPKVVF